MNLVICEDSGSEGGHSDDNCSAASESNALSLPQRMIKKKPPHIIFNTL
jgi:hypothetical protein